MSEPEDLSGPVKTLIDGNFIRDPKVKPELPSQDGFTFLIHRKVINDHCFKSLNFLVVRYAALDNANCYFHLKWMLKLATEFLPIS